MHSQTRLPLAGQKTDGCYRSVSLPIYQSAIFRFADTDQKPEFDYSRSGNPTRLALEQMLADLEGGADAVAVGSGMAAISSLLAVYDASAHVICSHDCYGGTERLLTWLAAQGKLQVTYADLTDLENLQSAVQPNTRAVWVETPSNPLLRITDLDAVGLFCQAHDLEFIVDNTFLSPLLQRPFEFGADFVVHSTTKYLNGHSDVVGGAIVARSSEGAERIRFASNALGTTAVPFDSWLVLRGMKTLAVRLRQHEENADRVARFLDGHDGVRHVFYPGLESHEGHELAARQQRGFGGMVSFEVDPSRVDVRGLLRGTEIFALAESLGGVESLIEQPATMSHASMRPEARLAAGITDQVVRLSVGIEHPDDLVNDLDRALASASTARPHRRRNGVAAHV